MPTPSKVDENSRPCSVKEIGDVRITEGQEENGNSFVMQDYWRASRRPHRMLAKRWTGRTRFVQDKSDPTELKPSLRILPNGGGGTEGSACTKPLGERTRYAEAYYPGGGRDDLGQDGGPCQVPSGDEGKEAL